MFILSNHIVLFERLCGEHRRVHPAEKGSTSASRTLLYSHAHFDVLPYRYTGDKNKSIQNSGPFSNCRLNEYLFPDNEDISLLNQLYRKRLTRKNNAVVINSNDHAGWANTEESVFFCKTVHIIKLTAVK